MEQRTKATLVNDKDFPVSDRKPPVRETFVPEPLLDSWQAAAMMNVHPKTLQKLARQGQIPGVHIGKLWRFRASVIEAWISAQMAS
jgi:excisionase family DNA binding protein